MAPTTTTTTPTLSAQLDSASGSLALNWSLSAADSTITKWQYRHQAGPAAWIAWTDIASSAAATRSHALTDLDPNLPHQFQVRPAYTGDAGGYPSAVVAAARYQFIQENRGIWISERRASPPDTEDKLANKTFTYDGTEYTIKRFDYKQTQFVDGSGKGIEDRYRYKMELELLTGETATKLPDSANAGLTLRVTNQADGRVLTYALTPWPDDQGCLDVNRYCSEPELYDNQYTGPFWTWPLSTPIESGTAQDVFVELYNSASQNSTDWFSTLTAGVFSSNYEGYDNLSTNKVGSMSDTTFTYYGEEYEIARLAYDHSFLENIILEFKDNKRLPTSVEDGLTLHIDNDVYSLVWYTYIDGYRSTRLVDFDTRPLRDGSTSTIKLSIAGPPPAPINLRAAPIHESGAVHVHWELPDDSSVSQWQYRYRPLGGD